MRFNSAVISTFCALIGIQTSSSFAPSFTTRVSKPSNLNAIGLGPGPEEETKLVKEPDVKEEDIVEPDHELFRESRLSDFDRTCDEWYGKILNTSQPSFLGKVSEEALRRITTLPKLEREVSKYKYVLKR